jgi:putative addiction module component (TIGR02574 family)
MITNDLARSALELPIEDRLELARRLVESVVQPAELTEAVKQGIRRIEDVATGKVAAMTEEQYRAALG